MEPRAVFFYGMCMEGSVFSFLSVKKTEVHGGFLPDSFIFAEVTMCLIIAEVDFALRFGFRSLYLRSYVLQHSQSKLYCAFGFRSLYIR